MDNLDSKVFIFKISLDFSQPEVWRYIIMSPRNTFAELNRMIQSCIGWTGSHYHGFEMKHPVTNEGNAIIPIWSSSGSERPSVIDENNVTLSEYFTDFNRNGNYTYDYGDCWEHTIELIEIANNENGDVEVMICVAGAGLGPPEDCGGINGYHDLLQVLGNPENPEHVALKEWLTTYCPNGITFLKGYLTGKWWLGLGDDADDSSDEV